MFDIVWLYHFNQNHKVGQPSSRRPQVPHLEDPRGGSREVPRRSLRRLGALDPLDPLGWERVQNVEGPGEILFMLYEILWSRIAMKPSTEKSILGVSNYEP